jgi:hypothetical protein
MEFSPNCDEKERRERMEKAELTDQGDQPASIK